jgi:hypothetical protein
VISVYPGAAEEWRMFQIPPRNLSPLRRFNVLKITIFTLTGEGYKTITNATAYCTQGSLLTASFTLPDGNEMSIRTTLPFFIEDDASKEATGF